MLLDDRSGFLRNTETGTPQAIAAFASLHIAMSFTAAVVAHRLRLDRRLRVALWTWLALTVVTTIYHGWHYVVDDLAGLLIGLIFPRCGAIADGLRLPGRRPTLHERRNPPCGRAYEVPLRGFEPRFPP